jgi:RHS repeat-associated protein
LQPTQIALGTSATNTSLLKLEYDYGNSDNNGNVKSQTITVPNMTNPLVQTYAYDSLNRLQSAEEKSNNVRQWIQTFIYDRYGNRRISSNANETTSSLIGDNPLISETNNRIIPQMDEQYLYDSIGNLTKDKTGNLFGYDAENRLSIYNNGASQGGANYYYNSDGRRVKKLVGTDATIFVYNALGQMVAEYSTTAPTNSTTSYLTSDTLGSPRINTNASGQVEARHDYMPFGEEIAGLSGRTSNLGYGTDNVRQKFSGKERDSETGLDYFLARYYANHHGRFTTTDPIIMSRERLGDPQRINLYAYVRNNPLNYVDPFGEDILLTGSQEDQDRYAQSLGAKLGFKLKAEKGKLVFIGNKPNGKKLSGGAKEIYKAITNTDDNGKKFEVKVNINTQRNDGTTDFGGPSADGKIQNIDFADIDKVKDVNIGDFGEGDILFHETLEAIGMQVNNFSQSVAHNWAAGLGGAALRADFSLIREDGRITERTSDGLVKSYEQYKEVFTINTGTNTSVPGSRITVQYTFRTPIPESVVRSSGDQYKFRANNPVNITKVSKTP